ncbi:MAG: ABC transporter ATP-binding protein [Acidobacteriota bacterium]
MSFDGPILSFRDVSKVYLQASGVPSYALRDVNIDVAAATQVALVGRSGSGKSTFLHLAAGIDTPTRGEILFLGRDLAELSERARTLERREKIGLVFQFFHLLPHLTVWENVVLPGWIAGEREEQYEARARELLERVELLHRSGDAAQRLSGGELQRVAICRALLRRPKLLLADEPTGNLDDESSRNVMDLLVRLVHEEQSTLIYVTHSQELAALADQKWRLHSGVLEAS